MQVLGIDIGGTGIKGAVVETETGAFVQPRFRLLTPQSAKPKPVAGVVNEIAQHFEWHGLIGCGFPAALRHGVAYTAANIHKSWIGTNVETLFSEATGCPVRVLNDADVAAIAEMTFGAGKGRKDSVMVVTIGTGLGTAMFVEGVLVPNLELGHIEIDGMDAESNASDLARKRDKLSWRKWAGRINRYLGTLEKLTWPDLIILGGGLVKRFNEFAPYLSVQAQLLPAQLMNDAGIVGAALAASK